MDHSAPTTLGVYREIAEAAGAEAHALWRHAQALKTAEHAAHVLGPDPAQLCFRQSLIAITFAGIYLEALLHEAGTARLGADWAVHWAHRVDERKLAGLGIADPELIEATRRFREGHHNLAHEKAVFASPPATGAETAIRDTQAEATAAIALIHRITEAIEAEALA